jgi:hypothetical protein
MIYKTQHRKIKIEQHKPHKKPGMNSGAPETLMKKEMSYKLDVYSG